MEVDAGGCMRRDGKGRAMNRTFLLMAQFGAADVPLSRVVDDAVAVAIRSGA